VVDVLDRVGEHAHRREHSRQAEERHAPAAERSGSTSGQRSGSSERSQSAKRSIGRPDGVPPGSASSTSGAQNSVKTTTHEIARPTATQCPSRGSGGSPRS
jgi:hypothetical protein